ncbi:hypothetical protein Tco_0724380 [Tanacetum coccineum]
MTAGGTESREQDIRSRSWNDTTHAVDINIRPVNDQEPFAENAENCQVTSPLLNPSPDNMTTEFANQSLESENISLKKTIAQFQKDFSRMKAHCVNMKLKYQNQALKFRQHGQISNETSIKAKIKREIEVLETINIELEHSVAKLLAKNENLHKENEHLKQNYKDLYDSIKKTRVQTKDHNDSLIAQVNSKTVENADLKAQIQEKGYRLSPNKSSAGHAKTNTPRSYLRWKPRSCLRWKPTGRIFNTIGLRWVPTGKIFTSSTIKVDSELLTGSNEDITNPYECEQTLNVSAGTLNLSAGTSFNPKKERLRVWLLKKLMSKNQVPQGIHKQKQSPNSSQGVKEQQQRAYFDDPCHELLHKVYIS